MKSFWLIIFMSVMQLTLLVAQQPYARQFTDEDGLPSLTVYEIAQDEKGFLWIGTSNGFCRYDGVNFIEYKSEEATDKEFIGVYVSPVNTIWTWNISGELFEVKDNRLELYKLSPINPTLPVNKVIGDSLGNIYLSFQAWSKKDFLICDTNKDSCYYQPKFEEIVDFIPFYSKIGKDNPRKGINCRIVNYQGFKEKSLSRRILNEKGFKRYNRFDFYYAREGFIYGFNRISRNIFKLKRTNRGTLGLEDIHLPVFHDAKNNNFNIRFFYESQDNNIWIIDEKQLYVFNKNYELIYHRPGFFKDAQLNYFFEDQEGGHWIGTDSKGLFYIPSFQMLTFNNAALPLNGGQITRLIGNEDDIIAATSQGTLFKLNNNKVKTVKKLYADFTLLKPRKNKKGYWLNSSSQGLFQLDNNFNKIKNYKKTSAVKDLIETDKKLIVGNQGVLMRIKKNAPINETPEILLQKRIYTVHQKNAQTILVGTVDGLYILENNEVKPFQLANTVQPFSHWVTDIASYQDLDIIATQNNGLFFFKNDQLHLHLDKSNGLFSNHSKKLFIDDYDRLWITSPKGISIIELKTMTIKILDKTNGLPSSNINAVYSKNDKVWISTSKGLTTFNFNDISFEEINFPIIISDIKIAGQSRKLQSFYYLNHDENTIYFEFLSPSYKPQGDVIYSYRMVGLDESWQYTNKNFVQYDRLKPDNYQFKVRAIANEGRENGVVKRINIRVKKSVYNTLGFYLVLLLIIGIMIFAGFRVWLNFYKKRQEKEAYFNRQFSELKISALQSQMNPHFIFNALNAIQHFFTTNDRESAMLYLGKFARLIRLIFEYSKISSITLAEELKFLSLYLQLEKLRFGKKIQIELVGMDIIGKEYILIPPLLIQPVIENAFKHGLLHKETDGELLIKFEKINDKMLRVLILDNGIGRAKAKEYGAWKPKEYKSSGVQTIKERVRLANRKGGKKDIQFNIIDLKDDYNQPTGTKVEFVFKIKKIINEFEDDGE